MISNRKFPRKTAIDETVVAADAGASQKPLEGGNFEKTPIGMKPKKKKSGVTKEAAEPQLGVQSDYKKQIDQAIEDGKEAVQRAGSSPEEASGELINMIMKGIHEDMPYIKVPDSTLKTYVSQKIGVSPQERPFKKSFGGGSEEMELLAGKGHPERKLSTEPTDEKVVLPDWMKGGPPGADRPVGPFGNRMRFKKDGEIEVTKESRFTDKEEKCIQAIKKKNRAEGKPAEGTKSGKGNPFAICQAKNEAKSPTKAGKTSTWEIVTYDSRGGAHPEVYKNKTRAEIDAILDRINDAGREFDVTEIDPAYAAQYLRDDKYGAVAQNKKKRTRTEAMTSQPALSQEYKRKGESPMPINPTNLKAFEAKLGRMTEAQLLRLEKSLLAEAESGASKKCKTCGDKGYIKSNTGEYEGECPDCGHDDSKPKQKTKAKEKNLKDTKNLREAEEEENENPFAEEAEEEGESEEHEESESAEEEAEEHEDGGEESEESEEEEAEEESEEHEESESEEAEEQEELEPAREEVGLEGGEGDDLLPEDVDEDELELGIESELEHVKSNENLSDEEKEALAMDIALDHLKEDPFYYTRLIAMENGECCTDEELGIGTAEGEGETAEAAEEAGEEIPAIAGGEEAEVEGEPGIEDIPPDEPIAGGEFAFGSEDEDSPDYIPPVPDDLPMAPIDLGEAPPLPEEMEEENKDYSAPEPPED